MLCATCLGRMDRVIEMCPACGTPRGPHDPGDARCDSCRGRLLHFERGAGAFLYIGPVKRLLHRLKFERLAVAAPALASCALEPLRALPFSGEIQALVPVPMHWRKRLQRGFNPAERIARALARGLGVPLLPVLEKHRATEPQVELLRSRRLKNPAGAFRVRTPRKVRGKVLLLVDDVMTTSATASECARVLREAEAEKVYAFAIARQA